MEPVHGLRRLVAGFIAFAITVIVQLLINSIFLKEIWQIMQEQGVLRTDNGLSSMLLYFVVTALGVWVMSELCQRAGNRLDSFYFGLLTGVLFSLSLILVHSFYLVQWQVPIVMIVANIVSFSLAGLMYGKVAFRKMI